jgi:16S rRNA (cytosine967-C5)-methyltransferase
MPSNKPFSARAAAWKTLNTSDIASHDTSDVLNRLLDKTDRGGQATDIVMGVVRLRGTLDRILKKCASLDTARVKPSQWNLLRMGVYVLVYCPKRAEYAILNEAAELAHGAGSKKGGGFINAVLRNVQRNIELRQAAITADKLRRIVPQDSENGCLFRVELLGDFRQEPEQYLSLAYSIPQALVHTWVTAYGAETAREICLASNRHPSVIVQPNVLKSAACAGGGNIGRSDPASLKKDSSCGQNENFGQKVHSGGQKYNGEGKLNRSKDYLEGLFYVQDTTAALTAEMLSPEPGWTILDLCAAPGGKAAAMAMRMRDEGVILASDIDAERLKRVRENARRLGLQCIEIVPAGRVDEAVRKQKRLDAIVLDVPCSNTGVLARRVEARWRWSAAEAEKLAAVQRELLQKAAEMARAGTRIVYSTCSIQPEENEQQAEWFLRKHPNFKRVQQQLTFPATETPERLDHDGGFAAVFIQCG